ncbi:hypothetical protein HPB47_027796, partial [Ixodes persulcatus]
EHEFPVQCLGLQALLPPACGGRGHLLQPVYSANGKEVPGTSTCCKRSPEDLHKRVVEEQKEFVASFRDLPDVRESYGIILPDALRFAKECLRQDLERLLHYPSHFEPHSELPLDCLNESLPRLLATPLQLGRCPVLKRPALDEDCSVEIDYGQLARRFLCEDTKEAGVHPSIGPLSEDSVGFRLALEHRANVLLELETMVVLLDNHGPEFDSPWELPLRVKQGAAHLQPLLLSCDVESGHNVACLDAAIPSAAFSKRRKNQLCYDFATRICMTCPSSTSSKVTPQAGQDTKEEPELIDDLFGPVKDMETFGVEPKIVPLSSSKSPTKRIPTTPKGSAESGCSCSSRIVTRRAKQQCAYCSRRANESPIRSPTPSSDGLVIDDDLVIDEDEPPDEGVGPMAQDAAPAERLEGVVPTEQSQTGGGDVQPSEMERLPTAVDENVPDEPVVATACLLCQMPRASATTSGRWVRAASCCEFRRTPLQRTGTDRCPPSTASTAGPQDRRSEKFKSRCTNAAITTLHSITGAVLIQLDTGVAWSVLPKLEYNAKYGAEAFTKAELVRQMAHLVFIPNSRLLRVRVDVRSSKVLLTEELGTGDLPTLSSSFRLGPGHYILDHKKDRATVQVLKTAEDKGRSSLDLHTVVQQRTFALNADCLAGPEEVLPLDPCVVLPVAFRGNQIPATFPVKRTFGPSLQLCCLHPAAGTATIESTACRLVWRHLSAPGDRFGCMGGMDAEHTGQECVPGTLLRCLHRVFDRCFAPYDSHPSKVVPSGDRWRHTSRGVVLWVVSILAAGHRSTGPDGLDVVLEVMLEVTLEVVLDIIFDVILEVFLDVVLKVVLEVILGAVLDVNFDVVL